MGVGYSVSAVTDFVGDSIGMLWVKSRLTDGEPATMPRELFGASAATEKLHLIRGTDPAHCTPQLGEPGAWCDRLPHFLLEYTPSSGAEIQSEYLMDRTYAPAAIEALRGIGRVIAPVLHCAEIRTVAADEFWLSPAYRRESFGIHFTGALTRPWLGRRSDRGRHRATSIRGHTGGKVFGERLDIAASYRGLPTSAPWLSTLTPPGCSATPSLPARSGGSERGR
jgi:hypothetical protein